MAKAMWVNKITKTNSVGQQFCFYILFVQPVLVDATNPEDDLDYKLELERKRRKAYSYLCHLEEAKV